ncbi:methyltransferase [Actinomadura rubrobrunea]|uniref:Methyltransferase n=1 Tax=Actinomadura rubrobrunea TaxID=115335 RepID=A0A9W6UYK6_9ACTN|nr:FAD-dependent oxidoreductase [Actinomadura rubrobrunea]GLW66347.1 methyltransferase [Actinomadura rubrobrunea]
MNEAYDVLVAGGGPAGLSGALALARARRSVLVVDAGEPRNAPAGHMHGYLGREGTPPGDLLADGRAEAARYGVDIVTGRVASAERRDVWFQVTLDDGRGVRARRLLVTTGLVDELPDVPGLAERWGREVLHCPYCHGWEVRDRRIGVLATGPSAVEQANMWRQWSSEVVLLLHRSPALGDDEAQRLAARGIAVVDGPVAALEVTEDALTGVRLESGKAVPLDALVVLPRYTARADLLESLGLKPVEVERHGHVVGTRIAVEATGATSVPGVWAAGNVADPGAKVVAAAAQGYAAGTAINADLIAEETRDAVADYRERARAVLEEGAWEERYRGGDALWSGNPNPQLVAEAAALRPGRALEAGCGEGADAVWLAERGWRVTGVDFSATALERAAARAEAAGVADRVEWTRADLRTHTPAERAYDLVSAHYLHLPPAARRDLFARLAAAVAPGGTLLIVGHRVDGRAGGRPLGFPDMMYGAGELASALDPGEWVVLVAEDRPRDAGHDGRHVTVYDAVLVARRRA